MTSSVAPPPTPEVKGLEDRYAFLNRALAQLTPGVGEEGDGLRLRAAQAFLDLGLGEPAHELLSAAGQTVKAHPEFAGMIETIPRTLGSQSWADHNHQFEQNLAELAKHGDQADTVAAAWRCEIDNYELYIDRQRVHQVRHRPTTGRDVWIGTLGHHRQLADSANLPPDIEQLMPGPYLFEGLDLGWFFHRVWHRTQNTFLQFSTALYLVEPDPALMAVVLHLHDWTRILADPRVKVFVGPDCTQRFEKLLHESLDWPAPVHAFCLSRHRPAPQPSAYEAATSIQRYRTSIAVQGMTDLQDRYAGRDARYWAKRFAEALDGTGPPLRILGPVSTHTTFLKYSMRDAQAAVERLGHTFRIVTESTLHEKISVTTYHRIMAEFEPDLLFLLDHLRPAFAGIIPDNLPMMTFDQDNLPGSFAKDKVEAMSCLDTVVGMPHCETQALYKCDPRQFLACQIPTDPGQWESQDLTSEEVQRYTCDISYVSHASQTAAGFHQSQLPQIQDPNVLRLLDAIYPLAVDAVQAGQPVDGRFMRHLLAQGEQQVGMQVRDDAVRNHLLGWYIWRLCDRVFRHQALEWAAEWARQRGRSLRIYGNGWDQHPTLAEFAAGPADNGRELTCIYRASKINLQLMPAGFIHQRALDGLSAGGFFLTRRAPGDTCLPGLRDLAKRIRQSGVQSHAALLDHGDQNLITDFQQMHRRIGLLDRQGKEAFHHVLIYADWQYAADLFADFDDIAFADRESFVQMADRFIDQDSQRLALAAQMRQAVVEQLSYDVVMERF
ncbi:MAG: hypothetical protein ACE5GE_13040, partial [Phycisphaerae bacterium]